ncbi:uncharacterized protein LOC142235890 [Haematobia irritans]|uniref:uncharacterized protein LOC142235890 n=1 Tax=Haematobia irritans TaxID=7368 RepID=UPI003F509A78
MLNNYGRSPCFFVGDSNINSLQTTSFQSISNLLQCYNFSNRHNLITRPDSGSSIDNVYSNLTCDIKIGALENKLSDHKMLLCSLESSSTKNDFVETVYQHCDYENVSNLIRHNLELSGLRGESSQDMSYLQALVSDAIVQSTTQIRKKHLLKYEFTPWINGNLKAIMDYKRKLLKLRKKKDSSDINSALKRISRIIKLATKRSMDNYLYDNLSNIQNNPRKCWQLLNQISGRSSKSEITVKDDLGNLISSDIAKAEKFNEYFLKSVDDLKRQLQSSSSDNYNSLRSLQRHNNRFRISLTNESEIENVIHNLELNKGCGSDEITPKAISACMRHLCPYLALIFNASINESTYPESLKIQKILPIPKEIRSTSLNQYRPISILSVFDKIFEKIIYSQMSSYLNEENLLFKRQYGFQKGCGTEEALINIINYICSSFDKGSPGVAGVFYDFSKAFDLVDHTIMCEKLYLYGIRGRELNFFRSYLQNRKQFVQINSSKSLLKDVVYGVPQGSVLGPLLFKIYINDISNLGLKGKLYMYADDISIFYPYKYELTLKANVERDASLICEFAKINKLVLNSNKTKFIRFRPHPHIETRTWSILVDSKIIPEVDTVKYLGINLQNNLGWKTHIQEIRNKIAPGLGILYKYKNKMDEQAKLMIFQSLIQSHLNYLPIIYGYKKNSDLKSLQILQNRALKIVYNLPERYPTFLLYRDVAKSVLPVFGLYKKQVLIYVYKVLNNIGFHTTQFLNNNYTINTRNRSNLRLPRCRLELTKQRIEFMGCLEYNNLPAFIKMSTCIASFKRQIKDYLEQNIEMLLI